MTKSTIEEVAQALLRSQIVVLGGLVRAKAVEPLMMRDWVQSYLDDMKPEERTKAFGACLRAIVDSLEKGTFARQGPPKFH
jgi:hypothetical protein